MTFAEQTSSEVAQKKFLNNVNIPTLCFCYFDVSYEMLEASEGLLFGWHFLPLVLHLRF